MPFSSLGNPLCYYVYFQHKQVMLVWWLHIVHYTNFNMYVYLCAHLIILNFFAYARDLLVQLLLLLGRSQWLCSSHFNSCLPCVCVMHKQFDSHCKSSHKGWSHSLSSVRKEASLEEGESRGYLVLGDHLKGKHAFISDGLLLVLP